MFASQKAEFARPLRGGGGNLKFWTNFGLVFAVAIGMLVVVSHGGTITSGIAWSGASLALGGLLGFLFGIPGVRSPGTVQINQPGVAAVSTEIGKVTGTGGAPLQHNSNSEVASAHDAPPPPPLPLSSPEVQQPRPAPPAGPATPPLPAADSHRDASNLEQVSDWVTKLLLGGGLTQMQQIPKMVWELAYSVAVGLNPDAKGQALWSEQAFAAGLLVYFFITGFFGGYLITKLQLGRRIG